MWSFVQPASQMQTTCNHASPGPPHPTSSETSHPNSWCNYWFTQCLHKLSETVSGRLICMLAVFTRVLTWLRFCIVTDFRGLPVAHMVWHKPRLYLVLKCVLCSDLVHILIVPTFLRWLKHSLWSDLPDHAHTVSGYYYKCRRIWTVKQFKSSKPS